MQKLVACSIIVFTANLSTTTINKKYYRMSQNSPPCYRDIAFQKAYNLYLKNASNLFDK